TGARLGDRKREPALAERARDGGRKRIVRAFAVNPLPDAGLHFTRGRVGERLRFALRLRASVDFDFYLREVGAIPDGHPGERRLEADEHLTELRFGLTEGLEVILM